MKLLEQSTPAVGDLIADRHVDARGVNDRGIGGRAAHVRQVAGGGSSSATAKPKTVKREMKFEFQTTNKVFRTDGKNREALGRKFGREGLQFLHKGVKGRKAHGRKEGSAIELQSESEGYVEFETATWIHEWCKVKERITEAVEMIEQINKQPSVRDDGKTRTVKFPFNIEHLRLPGRYGHRQSPLGKNEWLEVDIVNPKWFAQIQASESFELTQFESYLKEHMRAHWVTKIIGSTKNILQNVNTAKIPDKGLYSLLLIVIQYILRIQSSSDYYAKQQQRELAKEHIPLMSRTNFSSIFHSLSRGEQKLFKKIVKTDAVLKELQLTHNDLVFPKGYVGLKQPGPTVYRWLVSIYNGRRDLLSTIGGDNDAMGRFDLKDGLVRFEARGTANHKQRRPAAEWVDFAQEVFARAYVERSRPDSELGYNPAKCP